MGIRYIWGKYTSEKRWTLNNLGEFRSITVPVEDSITYKYSMVACPNKPSFNASTGKVYYPHTDWDYSNPMSIVSESNSYGTDEFPYVFFIDKDERPSRGNTITNAEVYEYMYRKYLHAYWRYFWQSSGSSNRRCELNCIRANDAGDTYSYYYYSRVQNDYPDEFQSYVSNRSPSAYPNYGVSGSYYYIAETQDNIDPTKVTIPDFISFGDTITITVTPSEDAVASSYGSISYRYEYSTNNGGSWQLINTTTSTTQQFTVPEDATRLKVRVRSSDNIGYTSADYVESKEVTISAAGSLVISGEDKDLGIVTSGIDFYVSSEDVAEALVTISTGGYSWKFTAQVGQTYTIDIFDLVNGSNTVTITATAEVVSGTLTATRTYQYAKAVQEFETGDAYTINQNGSVFYPLLVAEGVKLSDGRTLDIALSSIMERLKQIEQQAS